jgi:hypothetical protein
VPSGVNGLATLFTAETRHNGDLPAPGQQLFCSVHYHVEDFAGGEIGQSRHFSDVDRAESTANLIQVAIQGGARWLDPQGIAGRKVTESAADLLVLTRARAKDQAYLARCAGAQLSILFRRV